MSIVDDANKFYKDSYGTGKDIVSLDKSVIGKHIRYEWGAFFGSHWDVNNALILFYLHKQILKNSSELVNLFILLNSPHLGTTLNISKVDSYLSVITALKSKSLKIPSKKEIAKKHIQPLLVKWINKNITDPDALLIYKKWITTESNLESIADAAVAIGSELEDYLYKAIPNNIIFEYQDDMSYLQVPANAFFDDLLNATNDLTDQDLSIQAFAGNEIGKANLDVPAILGFDQLLDDIFSEDRSDNGSFGARTAKELEAELKKDPAAFAKITSGVQGVSYKKPTDEELVSLRQCALITRLLHQTGPKEFHNYFNDHNFTKSPLNTNNPGHSRIYPVDPSEDPNVFYNKCNISNAARKTLEVNDTSDVDSPATLHKTLWWVFDTDEGLKEIELALTKNAAEKVKVKNYYKLVQAQSIYNDRSLTADQKSSRVKSIFGAAKSEDAVQQGLSTALNTSDTFKESGDAYYFLENAEIKYEGTNPSTARNDVQVQLTFQLSSMKALQCVMATIPKEHTRTDEDPEIKLYELITLPVTNKISKGPGAFLKNQFNPEYSRVRLKVYNGVDHKSDLIIDLSTIDHSISRSSETGATTLTVNYRGFFEAMMNMPFNDALASEDTLKRREELHAEAMKVLQTNDCKPELINRAMRIEQEIFRRETKTNSPSSILAKLSNSKNIHGYSLDESQLFARAINGTLDSRQDYVTNVVPGTTLSQQQLDDLDKATQEKDKDDDSEKVNLSFAKNKFFFLGDLLYYVSECLYDPNDPLKMRPIVKNLNMRFVLGSINVPNPKTRDGSMITINPACIPVDLTYFIEWFNSTIVNKGLTTFPVGLFIKELIERLINNIIFEVCFSSLLPGENPPLIRIQFISNFDDKGWFVKNDDGWFESDIPYWRRKGQSQRLYRKELRENNIFVKNALFNRTNPNQEVYDVKPYNYCVIYQQFPTFSHYTTKDKTQKLRNKPFVPTIFYGAKNTNFNYVSNVSFSKTDSDFLREARYFNSNYGNLSLLSNVYDLNFSFIKRKANTYLYPGIIINFVLLDWDTTGSTSPYIMLANNSGAAGNPSNSDDYTVFGQANPHSEETLAHILGFGGYYIIKSVTYKLGQTEDLWEISITTKFMGTDAKKDPVRKDNSEVSIEDKEKCVKAFDKLATRARELGGEDDEYFINATIETESDTATVTKESVREDFVYTEYEESDNSEDFEAPECEREPEVVEAPTPDDEVEELVDNNTKFISVIQKHFGLTAIEQPDGGSTGTIESLRGLDPKLSDDNSMVNIVYDIGAELGGTPKKGWFEDRNGKTYLISYDKYGQIYIGTKRI